MTRRKTIRERIAQSSREQVVSLLEAVSSACYDTESIETLQEALFANVADGTISSSEFPD